MLAYVLGRLRAALLAALSLISSCFCCIRRRRRNSDAATTLTISTRQQNPGSSESDTWEDWGPEIVITEKKPSTTSEHIEAYRQALNRKVSASEEPEVVEKDLFADMAPKIRKQKKVFIGSDESSTGAANSTATVSSKFAPRPETADPVLALGSELASWEEGEGGAAGGWSPEEEAGLADLLREQRSRFKR